MKEGKSALDWKQYSIPNCQQGLKISFGLFKVIHMNFQCQYNHLEIELDISFIKEHKFDTRKLLDS